MENRIRPGLMMHVVTEKDLRIFGLIMAGFIAVVFGIVFPFVFNIQTKAYPWYLALFFLSSSIVFPRILFPVYRMWEAFGKFIGWVNTKIILTLIFFIIFVPAAVIMRVTKYDSMKRSLDLNGQTYRINADSIRRTDSMEDPF